jgi:hypothetical protein
VEKSYTFFTEKSSKGLFSHEIYDYAEDEKLMSTATDKVNAEMTVDETIRKYPGAQKVFVKYGVDTCCGGYRKIKDAIKVSGASLEKLLADLEAIAQ